MNNVINLLRDDSPTDLMSFDELRLKQCELNVS